MDWQREHFPGTPGPQVRTRTRSSTRPAAPGEKQERLWLDHAVNHLLRTRPELSSAYRLVDWQIATLLSLAAGLILGAVLVPSATLTFVFAAMVVPFFCTVVIRALALLTMLTQASSPLKKVTMEELSTGEPLPRYAILVPLYQETDVLPGLISALTSIDYPRDRLEISLVVEKGDIATRAALSRQDLPPHMRTVCVPEGQPRTKPRAINYALASATGDYVVVYDAEDNPQPDQLLKALAAFRAAGPQLGCVQAHLNIYNPNESFLTRQFCIEYTALFDAIVPTLARLDLPVPLGGTSNHFPRHVLETSGGWDPFNVTEDADLGIRLARQGLRVGALSSTTWEEAPATFRVWLGQRTRWLKGWMQTYIVHMRDPVSLLAELGFWRFTGLQILMAGMILSCLVHPWFYVALAIGLAAGNPALLPGPDQQLLYWIGLFNLLAGYVFAMALGAVAIARRGRSALVSSCIAMPVYWLLISCAAYRALWQLMTAPHRWEKTHHRARDTVAGQDV